MKRAILITCSILFASLLGNAQYDSYNPPRVYQSWIKTYDGRRVLTGFLYETRDSSVMLSRSYDPHSRSVSTVDLSKIDARSIDYIQVRKKGNSGMGILIGGLSGLAAAVALDVILVSSWKKSERDVNTLDGALNYMFVQTPQFIAAIAGSIGLLGVGLTIGAAIGGAKVTIPIHGNQQVYDENRFRIDRYVTSDKSQLATATFSKNRDSVTDFDGNVYHTLALGGQVWLASNLKVSRFRNGDSIPGVQAVAGKSRELFDWSTVHDGRNICPSGWHVPSGEEWTSLYHSLGGDPLAAKKLEADFSTDRETSQWWSSTEIDATVAKAFYLNLDTDVSVLTKFRKSSRLPVRCLRDN